VTEDRILVAGLGNPILGDDGVGWHVLDALERVLDDPRVELDRLAVGGIALMERLLGYRAAILVDAILGGDDPAGTVWCRPLAEVVTRTASHLDSSHDAPLPGALLAAAAMGGAVPDEVLVVGIGIERGDIFRETLTPPVEAAVGRAVEAVAWALGRLLASPAPAVVGVG
jgi:hydrogenase maturation protease